MAIVTLAAPIILSPWREFSAPSFTTITLDAAGESLAGVGTIVLSTGPGTSATLSAAGGGGIYVLAGPSSTFANGSTTFRVGVQDLSGNLEDGSYDVYGELTGGADLITASAVNFIPMTSGSKTIAHGDPIAIVSELMARGGADAVQVQRGGAQGFLHVHNTVDSGSGPAGNTSSPICAILFDDGTLGWLLGTNGVYANGSVAVTAASTPNEYATILTPTVPYRVVGLCVTPSSANNASDAGSLTLYSDPAGTPVAERTATAIVDTRILAAAGTWIGTFTSPFTLTAGADVAAGFAVSGGAVTVNQAAYGSGRGALRGATIAGTGWRRGTRSGGTGAFSNDAADAEFLPFIGFLVDGFDDGVSAGGGGGAHILGGTVVK